MLRGKKGKRELCIEEWQLICFFFIYIISAIDGIAPIQIDLNVEHSYNEF